VTVEKAHPYGYVLYGILKTSLGLSDTAHVNQNKNAEETEATLLQIKKAI